MVSVNPNNSAEPGFYLDPTGMAVPTVTTSSDDPSKKIRKPYTITKSRESWTEPEHDKFLEALQLFDRDWKKIEAFIGSKTVIQIRSHAQKYFLKVQKSGTNEHLPPPRPKRKAAHPYPQKASKNDPVLSASFQTSPALTEPGYRKTNPSKLVRHPVSVPVIPPQVHGSAQTVNFAHMTKEDLTSRGQQAINNCCSSSESTPRTQPSSAVNGQRSQIPSLRVLPDFAQVYGFIGSVFDPDASGHLQKLKKMDKIDVETVLLLMRNLSINLTSPGFEDHRRLLSTYEIDSDKENSNDVIDTLLDCQPELAADFG